MTANLHTFFYYGVGALALIALADVLPKAAVMFTIILVVGVLLTNWKTYAPLLNPQKGK